MFIFPEEIDPLNLTDDCTHEIVSGVVIFTNRSGSSLTITETIESQPLLAVKISIPEVSVPLYVVPLKVKESPKQMVVSNKPVIKGYSMTVIVTIESQPLAAVNGFCSSVVYPVISNTI